MFAKCDYLTLNIYSVSKLSQRYGTLDSLESRFKCKRITKHFVHGQECVTFQYSGKNIDQLGQSFFDIIRELTNGNNYTCSRIDFALDFNARLDYQTLDADNQKTAGNTGRFGNERSGRTISAGTRGYKLVRLYEKGKEQGSKNREWQRLEIEYSQHLARDWFVIYLENEHDIEYLTEKVFYSICNTMPVAKSLDVLALTSDIDKEKVLPKTYTDKFMRHITLCSKALSESPSLATDIARRLSDFEFLSVISAFADEATRRTRELSEKTEFAQECAQKLRIVLDATLLEKRDYLHQIAQEYKAMVDLLASES